MLQVMRQASIVAWVAFATCPHRHGDFDARRAVVGRHIHRHAIAQGVYAHLEWVVWHKFIRIIAVLGSLGGGLRYQ